MSLSLVRPSLPFSTLAHRFAPRRPDRRTAALFAAASSALALGAGPLAATAFAAGPEANLQVQVLKITGKTFGAGAVIPSGTALSRVTITTADPDSGSTDSGFLTSGEAVTTRVAGVAISTTWRAPRATALTTNAGSFTGLVFNAGRDAYIIVPVNQPVAAVTKTTAASTLNSNSVDYLNTVNNGFVPEGTHARPGGRAYSEVFEFGSQTGSGIGDFVVYDTDDLSGTSDSVGDELVVSDLHGQISNGFVSTLPNRLSSAQSTTVQFADGTISTVRSVRYVSYGNYALEVDTYLFDVARLAATGHTPADVRHVVSNAPASHVLTWTALGFAA